MSRLRTLLLYEVCSLFLLLLQAQTQGAPTTTSSYHVPNDDKFLPLVEVEGKTAGRQLLNAEHSVLFNPDTEELRRIRDFFKERSQEFLQRYNIPSSNDSIDESEEEREELHITRLEDQLVKQCTHGKDGKQKREEQCDDRQNESDRTREGKQYHEEKHGGSSSFVQRETSRSRGDRYRACEDQEREDDCDVLGLNKDGTDLLELDFEWDVPESFSAERCASLKNEKKKREMARLLTFFQWTGYRSVDEYKFLNPVKEGAYGIVYRAREKRTGAIVALKMLKSERHRVGVPMTTYPEIRTLLKVGDHPNIVNLQEVVLCSKMEKIYLVMEFVDRDLERAIDTVLYCKKRFTIGEVKNLFRQLLSGVAYLHDKWILHRDLKPQNLLVTNEGILKITDFGLSREYAHALKPYSPVVISLWYRPPELLLGAKKYSTAIDMWSCGCIFAELLKMKALFPGENALDQIIRIFSNPAPCTCCFSHEVCEIAFVSPGNVWKACSKTQNVDLGTPNETIWPGFNSLPASNEAKFEEHAPGGLEKKFSTCVVDEKGLGLLKRLLTYDPAMRLSARGALDHEWFLHFPEPSPVCMTAYEQRRHEIKKSNMKAYFQMLQTEINKAFENLQFEPKKEKAGPSSAMQLD